MALFRILLIFLLIYFVFKIIGRMIFPAAGRSNHFFEDQRDKEGDVIVEDKSAGNKKVSDKEGEYIDFEEID